MLMWETCHKPTGKWSPFLILFLACLITELTSAFFCNPSYISRTFPEYPETKQNYEILDVEKACSLPDTYSGIILQGTENQFVLSMSKLVCKDPDAEARMKDNNAVYANPWTITLNISDLTGNFTILTVFVRITSINDFPATITNLTIPDIRENTAAGTRVGGCTLTDGDYPGSGHDIPYVEIIAGNEDNRFAVDYKTCDVTLIAPLTYAKKNSYTLTFRAYNFLNDPASTNMAVTFQVKPVNSQLYPPRCSPFNIFTSVLEDATVNTTVVATLRCTAVDGTGTVDYYGTSPGAVSFFDVNEQTGNIILINKLTFDNNTPANNLKQLYVDVVPHGQQSPATTVTVQIKVLDVDDHKPLFTSNLFSKTVSSKTTIGSPILTVSATDADAPNTINSKITFGFESPCTPDVLVIDGTTGTLYLKVPLTGPSEITCKAYAYSSNRTLDKDFAVMNIKVVEDRNKPPVFSQSSYQGNVTENSASGFSVLSVRATDPDNGIIQYSFPPGSIPPNWPFAVDMSGTVTVTSLINYEQTTSYFAPVVATDTGVPPLTATAYIAVTVNPVNEFSPAFVSSSLRDPHINKQDKPGTLVTTLTATDNDAGNDGEIEYYLADTNVPFVLDKETGTLRTGIGLDQVNSQFYNLVVVVVDKSKTNVRSSSATVRIVFNADNRNNNDPVCDPLGPITVTPNKPNIGSPIGFLTCTDADANTHLNYAITGGNVRNLFEIETYNGTIRLATTPVAGTYILVLSVSDEGSPARTAEVSVQINVQTILTFRNLPASLSVPENFNDGNAVYTVLAEGAFVPVTYTIIVGNTDGMFNLHKLTGEIRLVNPLDRESASSYDLEIQAAVQNGQSVTQHLKITVLDKNDNKPSFGSSFDYLRILETQSAPSPLKKYAAIDRDIQENSQLDYSIISGDPGHVFAYDSSEVLSLKSKLDYETQSFYTLVLGVSDRGNPSLNNSMIVFLEVIDDKNDNNVKIVPSGGTVSLSRPEDTAIGSALIKIDVQNNDSRSDLLFEITSGNSGNNFTVGSSTGVVYLSYALDREIADFMNTGIRVSNANGKTANTMLVINITDVNDNDPVFNPDNYIFLVPHGTMPGSTIGTLSVTDLDIGVNKDLTLSIISGDINRFSLSGKTLMAASIFDANVQSYNQLIIQASDHGIPSRNSTASVIVIIQPEFKKPMFVPKASNTWVEETRVPGSLLYDADATYNGATERSSTSEGDLVYSLGSGGSRTFFVEPEIGEVQLIAPLVYSPDTSYTLIITASNKKALSLSDNFTLTIIVTQVNRYAPVFSTDIYVWSVSETATVGTTIGRLTATDKDLGEYGIVTYAIKSNTNFKVNTTTGIITLASSLEYSTMKSYNIFATANDKAGINSRTTLVVIVINVIDENNHAPVFSGAPFIVTVPENVQVGTVIQIISAEDLDSGLFGTVSYSVISGNSNGLFALDPTTGALSIGSRLDFERGRQYVLLVQGKDDGTPPLSDTTTVTINVIDVNDNKPDFGTTRIEFTIKNDTPPLTPVYQVTASDKDSRMNGVVNYVIQSGNDDHLFSIDTVKGVIKTARSLASAGSFQTLIVAGIDQGIPPLTGTVTVVVTVQPVQSPGPANYDFSIPENDVVGTVVGTVPTDPSLNNITEYIIRGGNSGNAFEISITANKDGVIRSKIQLDRETYAYYQLVISVKYATGTRYVTANIKVMDVNDNAPIFDKSVMNVQVVENQPAGYVVGTFTVTDADENGVNNQVDLSLSPAAPPASNYFSVDQSGNVILVNSISYEDISGLTFYVAAKDRGIPQQTSTATVNVKVVDVTETKEYNYFQTASYITHDFPDDASDGDVVCLLTAADVGVALKSGDTVSYAIVGRDSVFDVHPSSGNMYVSKASFIFSGTRYFQWVIITVTSGGNITSSSLLIRLDTFNKKRNMFSVRVNSDIADLLTRQIAVLANLQSVFNSIQSVQIWSTRSISPSIGKRKLLASESEILAVVEADRSVNNVSNIGMTKTFLTSEEAMKKLQQSSDGTPVASLAASSPSVTSVKPYSENDDDGLDPAYIALIVVGSIVVLALIIGLIALIIYCTYYRRSKDADKKSLVDKKKQTQPIFGNIDQSKTTKVQSGPDIHETVPDDSNSDGMHIRPTTAMFISTPQTSSSVIEPKPKKNSSTMLESLEEVIEEDDIDDTSPA